MGFHDSRRVTARAAGLVGLLLLVPTAPVLAQSARPQPTGRLSTHVNTASRDSGDGARQRDTELATGITLDSPRTDENGVEYGVELRHTRYTSGTRPDRVSIYDGFVGARFGGDTQVRVRAGHMWLQDLGSMGALAGGLLEVGSRRSATSGGFRAGVFNGLEPSVYDTGYAPGIRKWGGYAAYESGYLRRHVVGYTHVSQGALTERSVLSLTNFIPVGRSFFAYQAAEFEVKGPAQGAVAPGLSYFLTNVRVSPSSRVELNGTYNRGRALDARRLTDDLLNGRALTSEAVEGLRYESAGGRITVEVVPRVRLYAGYARDRTNRDDAATGRVTLGGYAGNVFGSGVDISGSDSRVQRASGAYSSRYLSVGRSLGQSVYVSMDYSTSLSVVRFLRADGVVIETRPSTRRVSGTGSITVSRHVSLLTTLDYTIDDAFRELRVLSGLSYRIR